MSVLKHISGTAGPIFANFSADPLWPWLGPPLAASRYVMYTSGFMDDVMFGRDRPYGDAWKAESLTYYIPLAALRDRDEV